MAIDRRALVEHVLEGYGTVVTTINPPTVLGRYAARVAGIGYDSAGAALLLDSAGWSRGRHGVRSRAGERLSLSMITQTGSVDRGIAEYVQAQLARVGIEVRIERLDPGAFQSRLNAGQFDLDIEVPNQNDANPAFLLALRWYSKSSTRSAAFTHASPLFDTLVERALSAATDDEARRAAAEAMHQLVDIEVGAIPLAGVSRTYAMSDGVRGFVPHPSRLNQDWSTVWHVR